MNRLREHAIETMLNLMPNHHPLVQEYTALNKNWRSKYQPDKQEYDESTKTLSSDIEVPADDIHLVIQAEATRLFDPDKTKNLGIICKDDFDFSKPYELNLIHNEQFTLRYGDDYILVEVTEK